MGNQDGGGQGSYMADPNQGGNQSGGYNSPAPSADLDDEIPF
jgi:single-strand DNA-binding protein